MCRYDGVLSGQAIHLSVRILRHRLRVRFHLDIHTDADNRTTQRLMVTVRKQVALGNVLTETPLGSDARGSRVFDLHFRMLVHALKRMPGLMSKRRNMDSVMVYRMVLVNPESVTVDKRLSHDQSLDHETTQISLSPMPDRRLGCLPILERRNDCTLVLVLDELLDFREVEDFTKGFDAGIILVVFPYCKHIGIR